MQLNKLLIINPLKLIKKLIKKICTIAAALGTAALAAVVIHKVVKGKGTPEAQKTAQEVKNIVKKFTDTDGNEVAKVVHEKGMMLSGDKPFSGTMEAVSKSGQKTKIIYEDGYMTKSYVNDKLYKEYYPATVFDHLEEDFTTLPRNKGVTILKYNEDGYQISENIHTFYDNGKVKRTTKYKEEARNSEIIAQEFSNGKLAAKAKYNGLETRHLDKLEAYDENGKITTKIFKQDGIWHEENYKNGIKIKERTSSNSKFLLGTNKWTQINFAKNNHESKSHLLLCDSVKYFNQNGEISRELIINHAGGTYTNEIKYSLEDKVYDIVVPTKEYKENLEKSGIGKKLSIAVTSNDEGRKELIATTDGKIKPFGKNEFTKSELDDLVKSLKAIVFDVEDKENGFLFRNNYYLKNLIENTLSALEG